MQQTLLGHDNESTEGGAGEKPQENLLLSLMHPVGMQTAFWGLPDTRWLLAA